MTMTASGHPAAHVHGLLHCNLNVRDVAATSAFYSDLFGFTTGMKTARMAADGRALGIEGEATSEAWFLYDHRGPRAAPAVEVLEWEDPPVLGEPPSSPRHLGLSAIGYTVDDPGALRERLVALGRPVFPIEAWPVAGQWLRVLRTTDLEGAAVEIVPADGSTAQPELAYVRINCSDLDASLEWYTRIGFSASSVKYLIRAPAEELGLGEVVLSCASLTTAEDPTFSLELTQWQTPKPVGTPLAAANHSGLYRIALGVDDTRAAHAELLDCLPGIPEPEFVALPGTRLGGVDVLFLRDPDGIVVELVQRPRAAMTGRASQSRASGRRDRPRGASMSTDRR